METSTTNTTNYDLVEQFMHYLLTLDSNEYTQFYCETCYERLDMAAEYRPGSPFHEDTSTCSHCERIDDVSNPHINRFLNENGVSLKPDRNLLRVGPYETDETAILFWNWLNPFNYIFKRRNDISHNEDALFTWVKYGRKMAKEVHRCSYLSETSKELLLTFYALRYRPDRFTPDSSDITVPPSGEPSMFKLAEESVSGAPTQYEQTVGLSLPFSTFDRFKSFVANMLNHWKGERI